MREGARSMPPGDYEHEEAGKQLHIETAFVMDQTTGQPLARATVLHDH